MSSPTQPDQVPPLLRQVADTLLMTARETICRGKEAVPALALVRNGAPPKLELHEIDIGATSEEREAAVAIMRARAHAFGADGVLLLSEVWTAPARSVLGHERKLRRFGEIAAMPDRVEKLMIIVETADGHWMGLAPLSGKGLDRRCGDIEFERVHALEGSRMANFLPTAAQLAARVDALARLEAALCAAGIDRLRWQDNCDVSPLESLEAILVKNPRLEIDDAKIAALVLAVQVLQRMWSA